MAAISRVSPPEAKKLIDEQGYTYLDVRSEQEFAAGHPAGAHNIPLMHSGPKGMTANPDFMDVVTAVYPKDTKLVVGCMAGGRSAKAADAMAAAGFTAVVDQRAGYKGVRDSFGAVTEPGWEGAGLPIETATPGGSYAELKSKAGK